MHTFCIHTVSGSWNFQLFIALFTAAVDILHLRLVYPLFNKMIANPHAVLPLGNSESHQSLCFFMLIAAYPLGQFLTSPQLGRYSDQNGRKKMLLLTVGGSAVGLCICGLGIKLSNPSLILIGRLLGGFMGASTALAYAAVIDCSTTKNRAGYLAFLPFSIITAFSAASLMHELDPSDATSSVTITLLLTLLNWGLIWFYLDIKPLSQSGSDHPSLWSVAYLSWRPLAVSFLLMTAAGLFSHYIVPFSIYQLKAAPEAARWLYLSLAVGAINGHFLVTRHLVQLEIRRTLLPWALSLLAVSLCFATLAPNLLILHIATAMTALCGCITYTLALDYLSEHAGIDRQGEIMGFGVMAQCLAFCLPAIVVCRYVSIFPAIPLIVGAYACLVAIVILHRPKKQYAEI